METNTGSHLGGVIQQTTNLKKAEVMKNEFRK